MANDKKRPGLPPEAAVCIPKRHPLSRIERAVKAIETNPANQPSPNQIAAVAGSGAVQPEHIAVMTTKYWRTGGVDLGVGFLDTPPRALRSKILSHMNAWGEGANILFRESNDSPQVRISRGEGGYWSYIGTDILTIAPDEPTLNLEEFTMETEDKEFYRVVRHETGHTLGCPHEHMRKELIALIDRGKAIAFFMRTQGWTEQEVIHQVLTPLDETTLQGTAPDSQSIMCYQMPGSLTKNGRPILGGLDIDQVDRDFIKLIYPPRVTAAAAPMTAAPASEAKSAEQSAAASAPADVPDGAKGAHGQDDELVEVLLGAGLRVLLERPVGRATLDRLSALLG